MAINKTKAIVTLIFSGGLLLLVSLGVWQFNRGVEKRALEEVLSASQAQYLALSSEPDEWNQYDHRKVSLSGKWITEKSLLMANRSYQSRIGYEVYSPFELADRSWILVNRGWVSKEKAENLAVEAEHSVKQTEIKGHFYLPKGGFTLGDMASETTGWPREILYFDQAQLTRLFEQKIAPGVLVIDESESMSLTRMWKPIVVDANRHFGYAVQWWGLAITMMIFGLIWWRQSKRNG